MSLNVYANGYGRAAKKTNISVYVHLMRGMFDEHLKWPIWCDVTLELLNQKGKERNCTVVIPFGTSKDDCAFRVTKVDRQGFIQRGGRPGIPPPPPQQKFPLPQDFELLTC